MFESISNKVTDSLFLLKDNDHKHTYALVFLVD